MTDVLDTLTPWPEDLEVGSLNHERLWPDGSDALWAFDDGGWSVFAEGTRRQGRFGRPVRTSDGVDIMVRTPENLLRAKAAAEAALVEYMISLEEEPFPSD